jgi:NADPH:quinone reductase-like Zn-dependent oxidoreductase
MKAFQIDRRYPFAEIPEAIAYLEQGHVRGKVVSGWWRKRTREPI